ncbi:MAG: DUF1553 domain-containing protein, partial [Acidobacteria bacterium]|nr:DUF1553 domain-containing protein [Acidobacteriota bacterium]
MKPMTTVPIMTELEESQRRTTRLQFRGNFLAVGDVVEPGFPESIFSVSLDVLANNAGPDRRPPDRLALARWLVHPDNPLTARVIANRYWEALFGRGIVETSEDFGSQGTLPENPELLDWLATELLRLQWDLKAFLRLLVTSAAYRQDSRVTPDALERDPENLLLARGTRLRLS